MKLQALIREHVFMIWNPFQKKSQAVLGIDIGTSSVKIVEITRTGGNKPVLTNYGIIGSDGEENAIHSSSLKILDAQVADVVQSVLQTAGIQGRNAAMAISIFSSFSTIIEFPRLSSEELEQAVSYEARKYVPLPLAEVRLDWLPLDFLSTEKILKVLVVAVPNEVIDKYYRLARLAGLEVSGLEIETFSVVRSCVGERQDAVVLLDLGGHSTSLTIAERGVATAHHNINTSGLELSKVLARGLGVDLHRAEEIKLQKGLQGDPQVADLLSPLINSILSEIQKVVQDYMQKGGSEPKELILVGGSARMKGLSAYTEKFLHLKTTVGDPFAGIQYPPVLKEILQELAPSLGVAAGLALRDFS